MGKLAGEKYRKKGLNMGECVSLQHKASNALIADMPRMRGWADGGMGALNLKHIKLIPSIPQRS